MADPETPTEVLPTIEPDETGRPPWQWPTERLLARWDALPTVGRGKTPAVARDDAKAILDGLVALVDEWGRAARSEAQGRERVANDRGRLVVENRALREQHAGHQQGAPTMAVEAVAGGQAQAERDRALILNAARSDANRIRANADEEARRVLADARLAAQARSPRPEPSGDVVEDFRAEVEWLSAELPAAEAYLADLQRRKADRAAQARAKSAELERWGQVLPIARPLLAEPIEIAEVAG